MSNNAIGLIEVLLDPELVLDQSPKNEELVHNYKSIHKQTYAIVEQRCSFFQQNMLSLQVQHLIACLFFMKTAQESQL